jgi:PAS domain S-box-containing protein
MRSLPPQSLAGPRALPGELADYLEGLMEGFVVYDADWRMTYMNAAAERIVGRRREEVLGKAWHEAFPHAIGNVVDLMYQRVMRDRTPERIELYYEHYGRWFEIGASPVRSGGIAVYFRDSTERNAAEEALRHERELLQAIIDAIPVMITMYEPNTQVLRLNREFERLIGWTAREAAGVSLMEACYPDPLHREEVRAFMDSCRPGWMDTVMRTRDGRELQTSWANIRLSDDTRIGIGLDISERKRGELALQRANEQLREAARHKDEFLATLAHELRNPLAPIRNAVQIMNLRGPSDPGLQAARDMIDRQVRHMVRLIDDLLDVSRITRGRLELRRERVALAAVLEQALETARPHLAHELVVSLPPEPVHLDADPVRVAQVFANLLTNACKYTAKGGRISLSAAHEGGAVVVTVKDTGIGIAREHLARLFDMFWQAAPALERGESGLGIGLSLARGLVEMHGGSITANSDGPGRGSEFAVRLPVLGRPRAGTTSTQEGKDPGTMGAHRILVVDDMQDAAQSLAALLRLDGHQVEIAQDGFEAVEKAGQFRPEVILLDIGLPKLNGYDACRAIRAEPWGGGMFIVALTGWGQDEDRRKSGEAGFDAHLVKPVDPDALGRLLASRAGKPPG